MVKPEGHSSQVQHSIELLDPTLIAAPLQLRTTQSSTLQRSRPKMPEPTWCSTEQSSTVLSTPHDIAPPEPPVTEQHEISQLEPTVIAGPKQSRTSQSQTSEPPPHWIIESDGASLPTTKQLLMQEFSPHRIPPPAQLMHEQSSMLLAGPQRMSEPVQKRTSQSHTSLPGPQRQTAPGPKTASSGHTHSWNEQSLTKHELTVGRSMQHPCHPRNAASYTSKLLRLTPGGAEARMHDSVPWTPRKVQPLQSISTSSRVSMRMQHLPDSPVMSPPT